MMPVLGIQDLKLAGQFFTEAVRICAKQELGQLACLVPSAYNLWMQIQLSLNDLPDGHSQDPIRDVWISPLHTKSDLVSIEVMVILIAASIATICSTCCCGLISQYGWKRSRQ